MQVMQHEQLKEVLTHHHEIPAVFAGERPMCDSCFFAAGVPTKIAYLQARSMGMS
jgi:hypothetical protein